jgi:hypothetical protein
VLFTGKIAATLPAPPPPPRFTSGLGNANTLMYRDPGSFRDPAYNVPLRSSLVHALVEMDFCMTTWPLLDFRFDSSEPQGHPKFVLQVHAFNCDSLRLVCLIF